MGDDRLAETSLPLSYRVEYMPDPRGTFFRVLAGEPGVWIADCAYLSHAEILRDALTRLRIPCRICDETGTTEHDCPRLAP